MDSPVVLVVVKLKLWSKNGLQVGVSPTKGTPSVVARSPDGFGRVVRFHLRAVPFVPCEV